MIGKNAMPFLIVFGIVLVVAGFAASYFFIFHRPNAPLGKNEVRIGNTIFVAEVASTTFEKARGLSFRDGLAEGHGMLFLFDGESGIQNFWMKDMRFAIDIIWIGGSKVLGFAENVAPQPGVSIWRLKIYNSPDGTDRVLEVNAGAVEEYHIKVGDPVQVDI
jgi:uncharacterized membrane protein (UPF0127 family)